jgi:hypothetical protein
MLTILGSLLGFAGSAIPSVIEFFNKKQDAKLEIELAKMKTAALATKADIDLKMFDRRQHADEHQRLIDHDIALTSDNSWVGGLRKSVRPVITYAFFIIFATVKISFLIHIVSDNGVGFSRAMELVWDPETQSIFAAVISFWFGSRGIDKVKNKNG